MTDKVYNIEDCLELITGFKHTASKFNINSSDREILNSIGRQCVRGTPLTDRQFALVKEKLEGYNNQFEYNKVLGWPQALEQLRHPLRHIDRSKSVTVVDAINDDMTSETLKGPWIKVRFPFNKKTILVIERIAKTAEKFYFHERGSHEHYFAYNEHCTFHVVDALKDRNFKIDEEILNYYKRVSEVRDNKDKYIPQYKNGTLLNVSDSLRAKIEDETEMDSIKIVDRCRRYGIEIDNKVPGRSLESEIVNRDETDILVNKQNHRLADLLKIILKLDRFPLLIGMNTRDAVYRLPECYDYFKGVIAAEKQSVLFRLDGDSDFNVFVKNRGLNNWVDKNTKIVYINSDKLPKLLLRQETDWKPIASLFFNSSINRYVDAYANECCDLTVFYDTSVSPLRKHSRLYSW